MLPEVRLRRVELAPKERAGRVHAVGAANATNATAASALSAATIAATSTAVDPTQPLLPSLPRPTHAPAHAPSPHTRDGHLGGFIRLARVAIDVNTSRLDPSSEPEPQTSNPP